jgi:hypothetical protein
MTGKQLYELFQQHGGVARIHTRPVKGGWANTSVAHDGFTRTQTATEDRNWTRYLDAMERKPREDA